MEPKFAVRIGNLTYPVYYIPKEEMKEKWGDCWGYIQYDPTSAIYLRSDMDEGRMRECLLHEIIHGCHEFASYDRSDKLTEEQATQRLSPILTMVFRENPHLKEYLF